MDPFTHTSSRIRQAVMFLAATLPLIAILLIYFFGLVSLLKLAVLAVLMSCFGLLILAFPKTGIYISVFYVYSGIGIYFQLPVAHVVMVVTFIAVCLKLLGGDKTKFDNRLFSWSAALFTLIALTSMLWAHSPELSFWRFVKFFQVLIITFIVLQLIKSPRDLEQYAAVIFWSAVLSILLGVANMMLGVNTDITMAGYGTLMRFEGTHVNPNSLGMYMTSALPLGFYMVKRATGLIPRILSVLAVFIVVLAVLASFSRGALFPLAFLLLATIFYEVKSLKIYLGIAVLAALSWLMTPAFYWERFGAISEIGEMIQQDQSIYLRIQVLKSALGLIADNFFTGVGFHNFLARSSSNLRGLIYVHNGYLELLVGVGIFGFLAWTGMIYAGLRDCYRSMRAKWPAGPVQMSSLSFYFLMATISALLSNLFDSNEFGYFLWVPLAGGLASGNILRRRIDTSIS
jgi:O-antigen ligase